MPQSNPIFFTYYRYTNSLVTFTYLVTGFAIPMLRRYDLNVTVWNVTQVLKLMNGAQSICIQYAIPELPSATVSKRVFVRNLSYENVFHLQAQFHANQTKFLLKGFARQLQLKQRHKANRKWPIVKSLVVKGSWGSAFIKRFLCIVHFSTRVRC